MQFRGSRKPQLALSARELCVQVQTKVGLGLCVRGAINLFMLWARAASDLVQRVRVLVEFLAARLRGPVMDHGGGAGAGAGSEPNMKMCGDVIIAIVGQDSYGMSQQQAASPISL